MNSVVEGITTRLRALLLDLGKGGGVISPSVYDTSHLLRLRPPAALQQGLDWLRARQEADGGWGPVRGSSLARHVPTLAALLTLRSQQEATGAAASIRAGIDFLRSRAGDWEGNLPDDIPVAAELILPVLLHEAAARGLDVAEAPYASVAALGARRRKLIAQLSPRAGTAAVHTWEAWGGESISEIVDGSGGVGHSPAATASWLQKRRGPAVDLDRSARAFLAQAEAATQRGAPLVPTVWPIDRFEQVWGLYALFALDLMHHESLRDLVSQQIADLRRAFRPAGIGMSDHFIHDGDMTSTALAVLTGFGEPIGVDVLDGYKRGPHFITYEHEMQPSVTTNAHAALALAVGGGDPAPAARFLAEAQSSDGRWTLDKWHSSWLYPTSQVVTALARAGVVAPVRRALHAIVQHQNEDGGWGIEGHSTAVETSYAVHVLHAVRRLTMEQETAERALLRATRWLLAYGEASLADGAMLWVGKELYCPYRVDQAFVLSAMLRLSLNAAEGGT
jgi:hypothetical protein